MEIHPIDATQRNMTSRKMIKSEMVGQTKDTFSKSKGQMEKIGLTAQDISGVLFDKRTVANNTIETDGNFNTKLILCEDGTIVAGGGELIIFNLTSYNPDGTVKWRGKDYIENNPAVDKNGNFYLATHNETISYDKDGNKRWEFSEWNGEWEKSDDYIKYNDVLVSGGSGSSGEPAIDEKRGTLYFGEYYGRIFGVEKDTGKIKWLRCRAGSISNCNPALDKDGNIFLRDNNGHVMSIKPNGEYNWNVGIGYPKYYPRSVRTLDDSNTMQWMKDVGFARRGHKKVSRKKKKRQEGDNFSVGTNQILMGDDQKVIFGSQDGRLIALDHDTGNIEMFFDAKEPISTPPVDAGDGKVAFANKKGHIYCVDTKETKKTQYGNEMKLLWDEKLDKNSKVEMVGKNGNIYVSSPEKGLLVYKPDGKVAWRMAVTPKTGITEGEDGSIWITNKKNIMELKPLAVRIETIMREGALVIDEETGQSAPSKPEIVVGESIVNIGGVKLERKKQ
ncbi:MAG: PQQ-binding-like beta-propeller repeat protein [Candidatus Eremiobacteraeota bacterium]|nr:PQQ-binding-like beta-propeller repeat protein [Candidatus Eremiobacteraeota bacterium]